MRTTSTTTTTTTIRSRAATRCAPRRSSRCSSRAASSQPALIDAIVAPLRAGHRPAERRQAWSRAPGSIRRIARRLLADGSAAIARARPDRRPAGRRTIVVVENTPGVHNVVVCTLCSCYPSARARPAARPGTRAPAYRSRVVREPRARAARDGPRAAAPRSRCASGTRAPRSATWCCPSGPRAPRAGARSGSPRWSRATR